MWARPPPPPSSFIQSTNIRSNYIEIVRGTNSSVLQILKISAFRSLSWVILLLTDMPLPITGVPLGLIMTFSADINLGKKFRLLTKSLFSYTEVHTCQVVPISAFRNLGRDILMFTELPLPNTGVPLGSIMTYQQT